MTNSTDAPHPNRRQIDLYFGLLTLTFGIVAQLVTIPVQFYLKDHLHLGAQTVALFGFITALPAYFSFLFGYLRDRWRPGSWGDRTYLLVCGFLAAAGYLSLCFGSVTYMRLVVMMFALTVLGQMIAAVIQAVSTTVAQRDEMTGQLSAVYWIGMNAPVAVAAFAGGWLNAHIAPAHIFFLVAISTALVALQGFWRPKTVYDGLPAHPARARDGIASLRRLIAHRPVWPAVLISGMWNVGLCFGTPALFYLTSHVHMSSEQFGTWSALSAVCFLPTTALYGFASRRWNLRPLLWWGTGLAVFQAVLFLFLHSAWEAYAAAIALGLCGGFVNGAYWDLLMRSALPGLEGTAVTLGAAASNVCGAGSNLLGAAMYAHGGFALSVWLTTLVYALIFVVLMTVPRWVTDSHDDQAVAPADLQPAEA